MSKPETFGQRLKRLREAKGWTHRQLMQEADHYVDTEALMSAELSVLPDIWAAFILSKVAKALGVSMDYLYSGVDSTANTPGKRIRQRRDALGWSLRYISEKTRFTSSCWAFYESDEYTSNDRAANDIAKVLGVTPEWILTGSDPKFPPKDRYVIDAAGNECFVGDYIWIRHDADRYPWCARLSKIVDGVPAVGNKSFHLTCGYKIIKATSQAPMELVEGDFAEPRCSPKPKPPTCPLPDEVDTVIEAIRTGKAIDPSKAWLKNFSTPLDGLLPAD